MYCVIVLEARTTITGIYCDLRLYISFGFRVWKHGMLIFFMSFQRIQESCRRSHVKSIDEMLTV